MRFGVIVTDDDPIRGGEKGTAEYIINRFNQNNHYQDVFIPIYAISGELPPLNKILSYDGFIITGSHYSVNDGHPWQVRLEKFIRQVFFISKEFGQPRIYAMCFGHQMIAKALGGRVSHNPNQVFHFGSVDVHIESSFSNEDYVKRHFGSHQRKPSLKMMKLHGECVVSIPKVARRIGSSVQCENEILMYGKTILTSQGHPEYTKTEMEKTNAPVVKSSGRIPPKKVLEKLPTINYEDVDNLTEMVRSFLRNTNESKKRKHKKANLGNRVHSFDNLLILV